MKVDVSSVIACSYEEAVEQVTRPRLLQYVAAPFVSFTPVDPPSFPRRWSPGTYQARLKLGGVIPFGKQAIVISFPETGNGFALRDNGHSPLIRQWDHLITISPTENGVLYRDTVLISAGLLTPVVWLFACVFYRHRQRRWRRLAASRFACLEP